VGTSPTTSRSGEFAPNPYVAFRGAQAWGSWSSAVIWNPQTALYYTAGAGCAGATAGTPICGYPPDKWGFAWLNGIEIKLPMIARGDRIGFFVNYGQGAGQYAGGTQVGSPGLFGGNGGLVGGVATLGTVAMGVKSDAVYINGSGIELTTTFSF